MVKKFILRRLGVAHDVGSVKPTLHSCLEAVLEQTDVLVDDLVSGLQSTLLPVQSKTVYAPPSPEAKKAIELLCTSRAQVKKTFATALRAALYGGDTKRIASSGAVRFDDFQFLDEAQIDANIEFALTQQEVVMAVDEVLPPLNALVSSLLGWATVQAHLNPLKPESFVYALRETLQAHIPSDAQRAALMTPAAGMLGVSLRQLYKEIADWLRSQGIEPVAATGLAGGAFGNVVKPPENTITRTLLTLDKLRRLLSGEFGDGAPAATGGDFLHTVPASLVALEDMKLVEPMMKRLADRSQQASTEARVPAAKQREHNQRKLLGNQLGEEVVRMMLESLHKDSRLLPEVRQHLNAMEPMLIKLSQSDARFFSERKHPAREFLDKITHRSVGFSSPDAPGFSEFVQTFAGAVRDLQAGEGDAAHFVKVLGELEAGWARNEQAQRQRAEEAARSLLHVEQRNLLAQRLAQDFSSRMEKKTIPDIVAAFLRGPWAQVVAESQLRCVDGSVDADGYLALVDDLIWSVRVRLAQRNRARLVQMVPNMLVKLRQGLLLIAYPAERMGLFFDELIAIHEQAFDVPRHASAPELPSAAAHEAAVRSIAQVPEALWMGEDEAAESGYLEEAHALPVEDVQTPLHPDVLPASEWTVDVLTIGSWVDLALGGQWVRAELTWTSPHRTLFMFISAGGMAHSMSRRTMDRLRSAGRIRWVSDGRIMDNALDAVAQAALRNDAVKNPPKH